MLKNANQNTDTKTPGKAINKSFTKDEFLTKRFLAAKFKESADLIEKTLKYIRLHRISFPINGHRTQVVVTGNTQRLRVHPMALDIFKEYLEKQKAKA